MRLNTDNGSLIGVTGTDGVSSFAGIPFAEPPTGVRRFGPPVRRGPWQAPRDASVPGPTPQRRPFSEYSVVPEPSIPGDDTLLVNVLISAPGRSDAKLPVLVWIHGGGYFAGSPSSPWYAGRAYARDGVVVVSVSYRLGMVGFARVAGAVDNRGVRDWIAAPQWVQREIHRFGGDHDRVTIAGQSAGGGAVTTLLSMPAAQHLFHQAIAQSPAIGAIEPDTAELTSAALAHAFQLTVLDADSLARIPEERLLDGQDEVLAAHGTVEQQQRDAFTRETALSTVFGPVRDGDLIERQPLEAIEAGVGATKPLLIGTTADEFVMTAWGLEGKLAQDDAVEFLVAGGLSEERARGYAEANGLHRAHEALGRMTTDTTFRRPVLRLATVPRHAGTWLYDFRWRSPRSGIAMHCMELPFMWGMQDDATANALVGDAAPAQLAEQMHAAWLAFIRNGDPGWAPVTADTPQGMVFDTVSRLDPDPYAAARLSPVPLRATP